MLLASYVDDDDGWLVPLWTEDEPASSLSASVKMTQNRNYCNCYVQTLENFGFPQNLLSKNCHHTVWHKASSQTT